MTHIIRRQYLHVELNGTESDGLALQHRLPDVCRNWLTPAIERALERCAPPDGHLSLERLDIDVGALTFERLERDLAEAVAQAVEKSLRGQILPGDSSSIIVASNVQQKTAQQSITEAFIYFLTTGSLPWSFRLPEGCHLEQVLLNSWQEAATSGIPLRAMSDAVLRVLGSVNVRRRLVRQFSVAFLNTLLAQLSSEGKKVIDDILQALHSSNEPLVDAKNFARHLWETVFANVAAGRVLTPTLLVGEAWCALSTTAGGQTTLARVLERHWPDSTNTGPAAAKRMAGTAIPLNSIEPKPLDLAISEKDPITLSEHPEASEGIYIENAGVVLLHPFLRQLFTALGIAVDDTLVQPERALCLLHFLITGQPIAPEYALVLPKILCNIPLGTPVECNLELTDAEKEEAVALLEAVIRHWEALRNTSPDGLRGTFLLRPGKVSLRDDGDWFLQVESQAFDILLDQLPWGIAMIKLPWMEKILWVEWN